MGISMKNKETVLLIHNYYQIPGGEDTVVSNEKKSLEENGYEVILYTRNNVELYQMSRARRFITLLCSNFFNWKTYYDMIRIIKEKNVDIVHVHNTLILISPAVYYAAKRCKIPVVQTVHNFRLECPGALFYRDNRICEECVQQGLYCAVKHKCYHNSRMQTMAYAMSLSLHRLLGIYKTVYFICLSEFNKEKLLLLNKRKAIIAPEKVYVKPNFTFEREEHGVAEEKDYYLYMGRMDDSKGVPMLLEAFEKLPDVSLRLAGDGKNAEEYKKKAAEKRLKNITFLGHLSKEELQETICGSKAVIVPSQWYETFGMVIIEAYACHKPVLVGDIGNISLLVEDGKTGYKFRYNDADALVDTIKRMEHEDRRAMGEESYKLFMEKYTQKQNFEVLHQIYSDILQVK